MPNIKPSFITIAACALLTLSACSKEDSHSTNDTSARDAAPGPLSETQPPSADAPARNEAPTDREDEARQ